MNPERWQQIKKIFEEALDKDSAERGEFIKEACGKDESLQREVEELLISYDGESFLDKPAYQAVPGLFESEAEDSFVGTQLGPYEVTKKIGKGGMGVVYLARDTRLDRPVAIKMLAPKYTSNSQQRERLKREARAAAKFSHPGIATVYSLEEMGDSFYIVSEYVQGPTLSQTMSLGAISFSKILDIAVQIAQAVTAAHEQGIIHRDLKPENVIVTQTGTVKILDFGLARVAPKNAAPSDPRLTRKGAFLGTPAYASPEQLLGSEVDQSTDIFSFGLMLYEMAAGSHPFLATDSMTTAARILEAEAQDLIKLNSAIPRDFDRIVRKCLNKKPADRYSSARDLLHELEQVRIRDAKELQPPSSNALWWWQFHQAVAGFGYYLMLYPMWRVKEWQGGIEGSLLFFPVVVAVGVAANLRLHLWFTSSYYVSELPSQRRRVRRWIRWADYLFVFMLALTAIRIHTLHAIIATLLMAVAIGAMVACLLIEPTTTRAAFDQTEQRL